MQPPRWDDPIDTVCAEAALTVLRRLQVRPTLYGFDGDRPVVRVQAGLTVLEGHRLPITDALLAVVPLLDLARVLVYSDVRVSDPELSDAFLRDAFATRGLTVETAERRGEEVATSAQLLEREVVDGTVRWHPVERDEDGLWGAAMRHYLTTDRERFGDQEDVAGMIYALSRSGMVVEVAPDQRERWHLDRLPVDQVRREDRRRVRALRRPASARRRRPTRQVRA